MTSLEIATNPSDIVFSGDGLERKAELDRLTYDQFDNMLIKDNAADRGLNSIEHGFDGHNVAVTTDLIYSDDPLETVIHFPPEQEDKPALLHYALDTAKRVPDVQDAALLLGAAVAYIHPFRDGNGHESRRLYTKLAAGDAFVAENPDILGKQGRWLIDIGSLLPNDFLISQARARLGSVDETMVRAEAAKVLCDSFLDSKIVMTSQDIPAGRIGIDDATTISVADYIRLATYNLVTSDVAKRYEWIPDEDGMRRRQVVGFKPDTRF